MGEHGEETGCQCGDEQRIRRGRGMEEGEVKLTVLPGCEHGPRLIVADRDNLAALHDRSGVLVLHVTVRKCER